MPPDTWQRSTAAGRIAVASLPLQWPRRQRGFTLAELLVSMGVLVLLVFLLRSLSTARQLLPFSVTSEWTRTHKRDKSLTVWRSISRRW